MVVKKKPSYVKVFGLPHLHENTAIKFVKNGIVISTGLNVSKNVAFFLTYQGDFLGKVFKGECMQVYKLAEHIKSKYVNDVTIMNIQKDLLERVQTDIKFVKEATSCR